MCAAYLPLATRAHDGSTTTRRPLSNLGYAFRDIDEQIAYWTRKYEVGGGTPMNHYSANAPTAAAAAPPSNAPPPDSGSSGSVPIATLLMHLDEERALRRKLEAEMRGAHAVSASLRDDLDKCRAELRTVKDQAESRARESALVAVDVADLRRRMESCERHRASAPEGPNSLCNPAGATVTMTPSDLAGILRTVLTTHGASTRPVTSPAASPRRHEHEKDYIAPNRPVSADSQAIPRRESPLRQHVLATSAAIPVVNDDRAARDVRSALVQATPWITDEERLRSLESASWPKDAGTTPVVRTEAQKQLENRWLAAFARDEPPTLLGGMTAPSRTDVARSEGEPQAERQETERKDSIRREAERKEAELLEADRKDTERKSVERREAERKEAERKEAERKDAERREAEQKEAEKREAERKDADGRQADRKGVPVVGADDSDDSAVVNGKLRGGQPAGRSSGVTSRARGGRALGALLRTAVDEDDASASEGPSSGDDALPGTRAMARPAALVQPVGAPNKTAKNQEEDGSDEGSDW